MGFFDNIKGASDLLDSVLGNPAPKAVSAPAQNSGRRGGYSRF